MIQNDIINIGNAIYEVLLSNVDIYNSVGTNIFPLVADKETKYPFIVYQKTGATINRNKDEWCQAQIGLTIYVRSDKYDESIDLATKVNDALLSIDDDVIQDINIIEIQMSSYSEDFSNDGFTQQINYNVIIQ